MLTNIDIEMFEKNIKYVFNDKAIVITAFCHSSYANEKKNGTNISYERLEFLGDAIVNFIISEHLYIKYPRFPEGELTRIRAIVVCEPTFYECAKSLELGRFLLLGKGEELTGGRERVSILADIFETVTGAIYLDGGIEKAKEFVLRQLIPIISDAISGAVFMDYKTGLQEILQKDINCKIEYMVVDEFGPDHNKQFVVQVKNKGELLGEGKGKSKKIAEQYAAKEALDKLKYL